MSCRIKYKNFRINGVKGLNLKIGSKKFQMTLLWHCVVIAIKTFQLMVRGWVKFFPHMTNLKHKENVPPDNTSKQSNVKSKAIDSTNSMILLNESGSSGKELTRIQKAIASSLYVT